MMNPSSRTGAGLPSPLELETATQVPKISAEPSLNNIPPPATQTYHTEQKQHKHEENRTKIKTSARPIARQQPRQKAPAEQQRKATRTRVRFSDWTPCYESCPSAARSRVKARQTRISIKARQTRISSLLLASQGPHVGYVCSTPQIFITTDIRRTDTTEFSGRLYVRRGKRASPLCRCSRYEVSQESSV